MIEHHYQNLVKEIVLIPDTESSKVLCNFNRIFRYT